MFLFIPPFWRVVTAAGVEPARVPRLHHVSRLSFAAFVYLSRPRWRVYYSVLIFQRATRLRSPRLQGWLFLMFPRPFSLLTYFVGWTTCAAFAFFTPLLLAPVTRFRSVQPRGGCFS